MSKINHQFVIEKPIALVFNGVSQPEVLDQWWTKSSKGRPEVGEAYQLYFGPQYDWQAIVTVCEPPHRFELTLGNVDPDWAGTKVGFMMKEEGQKTIVDFYHNGWPAENDHFRISSFCWAMYLRILKRHLEAGETVPYEERLNV